MVAEWELIESRKISGKGVLRVPPDKDKNRAYILYASVVRQPKNAYKNFNYSPPRGRYGFLTFLRKEYVLNNASMEYEQQAYDGVNDIAGQTLFALKCVNNAILQSIFNLSVALAATPGGQGLTPVNFDNVIKEYTNLRLSWDECRFVCYADTAVSLRLYRLKYDVCNPDFEDDNPPPPPPPPPPPVPPGTPIFDIDEPYEEDPVTTPYPEDQYPEDPELPPPGTQLQVTIVYKELTGRFAGTIRTDTRDVIAPYYVEIKLTEYIRLYTSLFSTPGQTMVLITEVSNPTGELLYEIISITDSAGYAVDVRYIQ